MAASIRSISIIVLAVGNVEPYSSLYVLLHTVPPLLWVNAYYYLVVFFSHLLYQADDRQFPFNPKSFIKAISLFFIVVNILFIVDNQDDNYKSAFAYTMLINSIAYILAGMGILYNGINLYKIIIQFEQQQDQLSEIITKIKYLSYFLGVMFLIRSGYCYLLSFGDVTFDPFSQMLALEILFLEILPYITSLFYKIQRKNISEQFLSLSQNPSQSNGDDYQEMSIMENNEQKA